jgi:uncharacterized protein YoxC
MSVSAGVDIGALVVKLAVVAVSVLSAGLIYFLKKKDEKIDENTKIVQEATAKVQLLEVKLDLYHQDQEEMKETIKGMVDCMNEIRVHLRTLPCTSKNCSSKRNN